MPQRQFWAQRHPAEIHFTMRIDPNDPQADPIATINVRDQAGATMSFAGASLPQGFAAWALADAIRAALEAWDVAGPDEARTAWARSVADWKRSVREAKL